MKVVTRRTIYRAAWAGLRTGMISAVTATALVAVVFLLLVCMVWFALWAPPPPALWVPLRLFLFLAWAGSGLFGAMVSVEELAGSKE